MFCVKGGYCITLMMDLLNGEEHCDTPLLGMVMHIAPSCCLWFVCFLAVDISLHSSWNYILHEIPHKMIYNMLVLLKKTNSKKILACNAVISQFASPNMAHTLKCHHCLCI